ncbi:hypothetical protein EU91_0155 [Prochlorococcus marinus str. GP2]|uniref:Uncharacterized protein n=1 Tax=Prochlorococcus marinus str. GP2 TaxID=59925 RepID=A0A0A1ZKM8_PROMR|nr:hypothetical protein EU91_0155 [Prochlorococcus marinus str. GP2]
MHSSNKVRYWKANILFKLLILSSSHTTPLGNFFYLKNTQ